MIALALLLGLAVALEVWLRRRRREDEPDYLARRRAAWGRPPKETDDEPPRLVPITARDVAEAVDGAARQRRRRFSVVPRA